MSKSSFTIRQRVNELLAQGYQCSQVIMMMGLEVQGKASPDLIKAVAGLSWGCGDGSCTCGCLTGACCLLSLILENHQTFRGQPDRKAAISTALVRWFWEDYGFPLGGIDCLSIREADGPGTPSERCQSIIEAVYYKVREVTMVNKPDLNTEKFNAN